MKSVLISIQPKWCELIANGKKTIEVRKTKPKLETPFKCFIYCTLPPKSEFFWHRDEEGRRTLGEYASELLKLPNGKIVYDYGMRLACEDGEYTKDNFLCRKVIGEFVCDDIGEFKVFENGSVQNWNYHNLERSCLTYDEIADYIGRSKSGYGWHISNLVIYDKPKELSEFTNGSSRLEFSETEDGFPLRWSGMTRPPQSWCYVDRKDGADGV